jgi:hypothetical protein
MLNVQTRKVRNLRVPTTNMESIIHDHSPQYWLDLVSSTTSLQEQRQILIEATTRFDIYPLTLDLVLIGIVAIILYSRSGLNLYKLNGNAICS